MALLAGCTTTYEGMPAGTDKAPELVPEAQRAPFDLTEQLRVATRACIDSELHGPARLQALLSQGYVVTNEIGGPDGYTRMEPSKGLFDRNAGMLRVYDAGGSPCTINVMRNKGYTAIAAIAGELTAQGWRKTDERLGRTFWSKGPDTLLLNGSSSSYSALADISLYRTKPRK
ncbi:hypothetical protein [uncultured Paracoccus sp.]|uniref:hypothetical protein n=1 Tax=uncultured Paracoccus sp. TaxID=189685 RepID=UPI0026166DA3|nr:hypothetical protein [uncultured Paracoccus sp.]